MQRLAPCLMFVGDQYGRAEEAIELYTSTFDDADVLDVERYAEDEGQSGIKHARIRVAGTELWLMDSQPHAFGFTPAISLVAQFDEAEQVDRAFGPLSEGGGVLMPLGAYPFSERFAWVADRFGVSWQLFHVGSHT
jgi:predicted 3-demethylubiquinone-9 3-methyltransferase (glyoxalase superfamily)